MSKPRSFSSTTKENEPLQVTVPQTLRKRPRLSPLPKRTSLKIAAWKCCADFGGALDLGLVVVVEPRVMGSWCNADVSAAWALFWLVDCDVECEAVSCPLYATTS